MAFNNANFERIGGGRRKLFLYVSTDVTGDIDASGYFNSVSNQLDQHDVIICIGNTGATPTVDLLVVTSASRAATVTVGSTEALLDV